VRRHLICGRTGDSEVPRPSRQDAVGSTEARTRVDDGRTADDPPERQWDRRLAPRLRHAVVATETLEPIEHRSGEVGDRHVRPLLEHEHAAAGLREGRCDDRSPRAGTDDYDVDAFAMAVGKVRPRRHIQIYRRGWLERALQRQVFRDRVAAHSRADSVVIDGFGSYGGRNDVSFDLPQRAVGFLVAPAAIVVAQRILDLRARRPLQEDELFQRGDVQPAEGDAGPVAASDPLRLLITRQFREPSAIARQDGTPLPGHHQRTDARRNGRVPRTDPIVHARRDHRFGGSRKKASVREEVVGEIAHSFADPDTPRAHARRQRRINRYCA
jgi:hypothetical protein